MAAHVVCALAQPSLTVGWGGEEDDGFRGIKGLPQLLGNASDFAVRECEYCGSADIGVVECMLPHRFNQQSMRCIFFFFYCAHVCVCLSVCFDGVFVPLCGPDMRWRFPPLASTVTLAHTATITTTSTHISLYC